MSAAWRTIGGKRKYFRSLWEANAARYLEWNKQAGYIKDWQHEPKTFWFEGIRRGCVSYKPDFCITHRDGSIEWVEVKGYYDAKSLTKIKRFKKYFPEERLRVMDGKWFAKNNRKMKLLIPDWEKGFTMGKPKDPKPPK